MGLYVCVCIFGGIVVLFVGSWTGGMREEKHTVRGTSDADAACGYAAVIRALVRKRSLASCEVGACRDGGDGRGEERDARGEGDGNHFCMDCAV